MTSRSSPWCKICGGNLIKGSCPEHESPSQTLDKKGADIAEKHNDPASEQCETSPSRLGGVGRLLTEAEMKLINNPFGKREKT